MLKHGSKRVTVCDVLFLYILQSKVVCGLGRGPQAFNSSGGKNACEIFFLTSHVLQVVACAFRDLIQVCSFFNPIQHKKLLYTVFMRMLFFSVFAYKLVGVKFRKLRGCTR